MEISLSRYGAASTRPSPASRLMTEFARGFRDGIDINLGVGYVNERTIPVACLVEAMQAVARDGATYRQAFNYGGPAGSANLTAAIRGFLLRNRIGGLDTATLGRNRLIIGACGASSLLDGIAEVLPPGVVVTSDPSYYIYTDALVRRGFELLAVPEDAEGIALEPLERKLHALGGRAREISFFYVVTVNNPSCTILSNARRRALYELAARLSREQNRCIPIFFDLAYELLVHDPAAPAMESVLPADDLGIAYEIGTLSKVIAPAMRIGYLLGPPGGFLTAMVEKTSDSGFSAPLFVQEMAGRLLERQIEEQLRAVNAGYREKALAVRAGIAEHLGPWVEECRGGSAGFYYYLTLAGIETHRESPFFRAVTVEGAAESPHAKVIYIPGEICVQPGGDLADKGRRQMRISYGFEQAETTVKALGLMREAIVSVRGATTGR
jgi:GntR family transcriptional regulator/MocR family aminotransferase